MLNLFRAATLPAKKATLSQMITQPKFWTAALGAAVLTLASSAARAASFGGLGFLQEGSFQTIVRGISPDGSFAVGFGDGPNSGTEAFLWTRGQGIGPIPPLVLGATSTDARAISANGVIVGQANSQAFRGQSGLGDLPGGQFISIAHDVSADGSVVAGAGNSAAGREASRWTASEGMVGLGVLPGRPGVSEAFAVSADGSTIVGVSGILGTNRPNHEAFRWTESTGMVGLGSLPTTLNHSVANDVSFDGSVIVGTSGVGSGTEAFRWTESEGMIGLGFLPGVGQSRATTMTPDGSIVLGQGSSFGGDLFIWDSANGMRSLVDVLTDDFDLDLTGWNLRTVVDISADGRSIVGNGINPDGVREAWIAQLDDVPGTVPGSTQGNPLLPDDPGSGAITGTFTFTDVFRGRWYDPPTAFGFEYTMTSDSLFTEILDFPIGIDSDDLFTVTVGDTVLGEFGAGDRVDFTALLGSGVSSFKITGIDPLVDGGDPTVFPIQLDFDTVTASFTMVALTADSVSTPEPSILLGLGTFALVGSTVLKRKRKG